MKMNRQYTRQQLIKRIVDLEEALKPFALMSYRFWSQREAGEVEHAIRQSNFEKACEVLTAQTQAGEG